MFLVPTFVENALSLAVGEDGLDVDAHGALGAVLAADDGEAEALLAGTLLEADRLDAEVLLQVPPPPRKRAELGRRRRRRGGGRRRLRDLKINVQGAITIQNRYLTTLSKHHL